MPFPGQPADTPIPQQLEGWNWGAFSVNWTWAIMNQCWFALLTVVLPALIIDAALILSAIYTVLQIGFETFYFYILLAAMLVINLAFMTVFGLKGSAWAWRAKVWQDEEQFRKAQRKTSRIGLLFLGITAAVWTFLIVLLIFAV